MDPYYRKGWFKAVIGLILLCLLFISFLPYAIRYGIEQWYLKQNVDSVVLEDVDINLFTGELRLQNMQVIKDGKAVLSLTEAIVETDWLPLFKKRSFFPQLHIEGLEADIEQDKNGDVNAAGILLPKQQADTDKAKTGWGFGLQAISINDARLDIRTPTQKADFHIDHVTLDQLETWSQQSTNIDFAGKINNAVLLVDGQIRPFKDQPDFNGHIRLAGLDIAPLAIHLQDHIQDLAGLLDIDSDLSIKHDPGNKTRIETDSEIKLSKLDIKSSINNISLDSLKWQGKTQLQLSDKMSMLGYLLTGKINSENAVYSDNTKQGYHYHHEKLGWDGTIKPVTDNLKQTHITGAINAQGLTLKHLHTQQELFHSNSLDIKGLDLVPGQQLNSQQIALQNLRALYTPKKVDSKKQQPALLQSTGLSIDHASYTDGNHIKLGNIRLQDALLHIRIRKDGKIDQLPQSGQAAATTKKSEANKGDETKKPLQFTINKFELSANSKLRFIDASVSPMFTSELLFSRASIRNINSTRPSAASPFIVDAKTDRYSTIHVDGDAYPFSKPLSLKVNGKIDNLNLPPLSSYSASLIGYDLRSGQLNASISANIKSGKIDSINKLTLSNLEVKGSDSKKSQDLTAQLSMPLDSALSLLRDKNNNIELKIPVKGDINKPDFDISDVINTALATAMQKASLAYLSHALQPYGSLITLAKLAKAAADHVSLNPITFAPASAQADDDARGYSEKIASLMTERPKLRIKLCGIATQQDSQALIMQKRDEWLKQRQKSIDDNDKDARPPAITISDEQLLQLASARAETIKDLLVNQHNIDPARLFLCQPAIAKEADAAPRVDLNI